MRRQTRRRVLTALRQDAALQIFQTELGHCLGPGLDCLAIAICRISCIAVTVPASRVAELVNQ